MKVSWLATLLMFFLVGAVQAGNVFLPALGGLTVSQVKSIQERAFSRTVRQQYDFSCGSAALATLLTYQYNDPVSEQEVFISMWNHGDQEKIQQEGFSLLDIKRYLDARGYEANGYEVSLDKLVENKVPAIMLISDHGYNHFVVVKGIDHERVLVGDPSSGARVIPRKRFEEILVTPIVFVITSHSENVVFNGRTDWQTRPLASLGAAMSAARLAQATIFNARKPGLF